MPKSRADIQREYRARKKAKDGEAYKRNEVERVMKYYVKSENMPKKKLEKRNYANMLRNRLSRAKRRLAAEVPNIPVEETSGYESAIDLPTEAGNGPGNRRIIVRLPAVTAKLNSVSGAKTSEDAEVANTSAAVHLPTQADRRILQMKLRT